MTITYPLALPTAPDLRKISWNARSVVASKPSPYSLRGQVQRHTGTRLEAGVELPPMTRAQASEWIGFLLSLDGIFGTFLLGDPVETTARGSLAGTPLVDGASQTGLILNTKGWTASASGVLLRSDWIQLGSGTTQRMHKIMTDATADGSGLAALDVWPRIVDSPSDSEAIVTANCKGVFRLGGNVSTWNIDTAQRYGISFAAVEAI